MNVATEKYGSTTIGGEVLLSKFNKLAKEHFQTTLKNDTDQINFIKESIRFFSLDLPAEIKEIFISANDAPLFWIFESTILTQIEEFMKFNFKGIAYAETHKQIKENYTRWATTKLKSEKEYYSNTTINFIERDINKHNFFKLILKGIIHTYQSSYYNYSKALEFYSNALELTNTLRLTDQLKIELKYVLLLYIGFLNLKEANYLAANTSFKDALDSKPQGCTAKLFSALSEINLNNEELAIYYLREVLTFDIHRLKIALKTNNSGMFNYFFRNAFIYNIFQEREFSKSVDAIEAMLNEFRTHDEGLLEKCLENFNLLKLKKMDEYYNEEIKKTISFLEKILPLYAKSTNTLLYAVYIELKNKLNELISGIIEEVRHRYHDEVKQGLLSYDSVIKDNLSAEKHLIAELENFKVKAKDNLEVSVQKLNENYDNESKSIDIKIENLHSIDRYNPRVSLSNNMTYNIIIAFIVFFIGGVAGYSNTVVDNASEFNSMFGLIVVNGSKWGAISFLVGVIISLILSALILMERYEIKSKLLRRQNYLKVERGKAISDLKEAALHKEKIMIESMNSSITYHKKKAEEVREQKLVAEKEMIAAANNQVTEFTAEIAKLAI